MTWNNIISTEELALRLSDADWVIVDCRFDLSRPDWGFESYQAGHIPRAVYAHLDNDLSGPKTAQTGRHPLPGQEKFFRTLSSWGIDQGKQVIVYDTSGGAYAVRLWWMLRLYGHETAAVLDGGFQKWTAEGRRIAQGVEQNAPGHFSGQFHPEMLVDEAEVERVRQDPGWKLVDARTAERYRGEQELIDPVAGHIPGAVNRFHGLNLDSNGMFKSPGALRREFGELLNGTDPANMVVYCGSGVTSLHHILAMERAGLKGGKVYVGSWSQWIKDPNRPQATGEE